MKYIIFNPKMSIFYAFLAGIIVAFSANLFSTAMLSKDIIIPTGAIYIASLFLMISSLGNISISWLLEEIKNEMILSGNPQNSKFLQNIVDGKSARLWLSFGIGIGTLAIAIALLIICKSGINI